MSYSPSPPMGSTTAVEFELMKTSPHSTLKSSLLKNGSRLTKKDTANKNSIKRSKSMWTFRTLNRSRKFSIDLVRREEFAVLSHSLYKKLFNDAVLRVC